LEHTAEVKFLSGPAKHMLFEHKRYEKVLRKVQGVPAFGKINNYNNQ